MSNCHTAVECRRRVRHLLRQLACRTINAKMVHRAGKKSAILRRRRRARGAGFFVRWTCDRSSRVEISPEESRLAFALPVSRESLVSAISSRRFFATDLIALSFSHMASHSCLIAALNARLLRDNGVANYTIRSQLLSYSRYEERDRKLFTKAYPVVLMRRCILCFKEQG